MGSTEDCCVDFFGEPVFWDVHGTAVCSALFEGWSEGVLLCDFARVHQATFGDFGVVLTLGVREDVHHLLVREGAECCLELFEAIRGGAKAAGVLRWGNRVESAGWWLQGFFQHLVDDVCGHSHQLVAPPELPCCR